MTIWIQVVNCDQLCLVTTSGLFSCTTLLIKNIIVKNRYVDTWKSKLIEEEHVLMSIPTCRDARCAGTIFLSEAREALVMPGNQKS
jgi:hypothetical protein